MTRRSHSLNAVIAAVLLIPLTARAQMLETETTRLIPAKVVEVGTAFEYQASSAGKELAVPTIIGFGLTDRFELMIEPVLYTSIRPKTGSTATGIGDVEATGSWMLSRERGHVPAFALAAEVKVPTASNRQIGTGKGDFTGYLIASKSLGIFDTHANVGYTLMGSPAGAHLRNVWNAALAAVARPTSRTNVFIEVLGVTASAPDGENGDASPTSPIPEGAGAELVGTVGIGHTFRPSTLLYAGWSYDNNSASQLKLGMTLSGFWR